MGATDQQISAFPGWLSQTFANGLEPAGQFGKYAQGDTINSNLQKYLQTPTDNNYQDLGSNQGSGGWLQHNIGDVINWATNPIDAATGNHMSSFTGRLGGQLYDNTFGQLGGAGGRIFGQNGIASNYTRHLMNMVAGAAMPGGEAITNGYRSDYANARQRGLTPGQANQVLGMNAVTSASALVGGGILNGVGAATSAGAGAGVGGVAGTGLSTGSALGNSAANAALLGAARGAASSAITGQNIGRGALTGLASGAIGAGAGGLGGAIGGNIGRIAGSTLGGAASGAVGAAINGGNIGRGIGMGALTGFGGSALGAAGGAVGGRFGATLGGQLGRFGANYLGNQLFAPQRASGLRLNNAGMPTGGVLPQPGLTPKAVPAIPGNNMGTDQQSLLGQVQARQPTTQQSMQQFAAQQYQQLLNQFNQQSQRGYA